MSRVLVPRKSAVLPDRQAKRMRGSEVTATLQQRAPLPDKPRSLDFNAEPACEWKDVMYSKDVLMNRFVYVGESMGIRGMRKFHYYLPTSNQYTFSYRPQGVF